MNENEFKQGRSLEQVCNDDKDNGFVMLDIRGINYCGIRPLNDRVECFYRSSEPDQNEMYQCNNPKYADKIEGDGGASIVYDGIGHA